MAWEIKAAEWNSSLGGGKGRVVEYVQSLRKQRLNTDDLTRIAETIDETFVSDWKGFCSYVTGNHTLTEEKLNKVIDISTRIHIAKSLDYPDDKDREIIELLKSETVVLSPETVNLLAMNYQKIHRRTKDFKDPAFSKMADDGFERLCLIRGYQRPSKK